MKVELPSVNGDPGIIWGVGFGVGGGGAVGMYVGGDSVGSGVAV